MLILKINMKFNCFFHLSSSKSRIINVWIVLLVAEWVNVCTTALPMLWLLLLLYYTTHKNGSVEITNEHGQSIENTCPQQNLDTDIDHQVDLFIKLHFHFPKHKFTCSRVEAKQSPTLSLVRGAKSPELATNVRHSDSYHWILTMKEFSIQGRNGRSWCH